MARYKASIYSGPKHTPQRTLMLIASLLGETNAQALKPDCSRQAAGTISVEFATMRDSVVEGIQKLDGVQAVLPVPR